METLVYQSKQVIRKVIALASHKFNVPTAKIGLISIDIEKRTYKKHGIEMIAHEIFFTVFDQELKSLGLINERELRS